MARDDEKNRRAEIARQDREVARLEQGLPEEMLRENAELERAREAIDRALAIRDGVHHAAMAGLAQGKQRVPLPSFLEPVRAKYPDGVPRGHTRRAMVLADWKKSESRVPEGSPRPRSLKRARIARAKTRNPKPSFLV